MKQINIGHWKFNLIPNIHTYKIPIWISFFLTFKISVLPLQSSIIRAEKTHFNIHYVEVYTYFRLLKTPLFWPRVKFVALLKMLKNVDPTQWHTSVILIVDFKIPIIVIEFWFNSLTKCGHIDQLKIVWQCLILAKVFATWKKCLWPRG